MMETDELPVLDPNVDFRQVRPIQQKRTIAFINHFIMKSVSFLNKFAENCESRLMEFEYKLEKVEAALLILESQLSSVPWLDSVEKVSTVSEVKSVVEEPVASPEIADSSVNTEQLDVAQSPSGPKACEDARFVKFFKMLQFGVPPAAVKLKMTTEGLDPTVLDNPNSVVPGYECDENK